jgi:lipopolysaccharide/colanic/teichoic acid biosynthesis glycosyltransferase
MSEALDLDVQYVECRSLRLDLVILLRTIPTVLARRGVR